MSFDQAHFMLRQTMKAAIAFDKKELWHSFRNEDIIELSLPTEEKRVFASIMGAAGEEFGLCLFRGADSFEDLRPVFESHDIDDLEATSQLAFSMEAMERVPPGWRKLLKKAGISGGPNKRVPIFLAKEPHSPPREIDSRETETLLYSLHGIRKGFEKGLVWGAAFRRPNEIPALRISGDPVDPQVSLPEDVSAAPYADDLPLPQMTPEGLDKAQEVVRAHYMAWLDEPLPVFKGNPRARCVVPRRGGARWRR